VHPTLALVALLSAFPIVLGTLDAGNRTPALELDSFIAWIDDGSVFLDTADAKRALTPEEQAVDRIKLLDGALARAAAEKKLVLLYAPRIIEETSGGIQMYRAPVLDVYMRQVVFCDPDVGALIEQRFVPLRVTLDEALCKHFGVRPLDFIEPAVLFLDSSGQVLHSVQRIRTFDALWFWHLLRNVLAKAGLGLPEDPPLGDPFDDELRKIATLRRAVQPEKALGLLDELERAIASEEDDWRTSLGGKEPRPDDPARERFRVQKNRIALERGRVLTRMGKALEALRPLQVAWQAGDAEAGYLLAIDRLALGDEAGSTNQFQLVAQRHADTLYGRRALANVTMGLDDRPLGAALCGFEHMTYLPAWTYEGLPPDTAWHGKPPTRAEMIERGVRFLLAQQRASGGFTESRYAYWNSSDITTNTWVAITALACAALLENRNALGSEGNALISAALQRGKEFLFDEKNLNRGSNEDVYADAYRLLFLARVRAEMPEASGWVVTAADQIVAAAGARQVPGGFFAHEYPNAFCTGVMLWSLLEARDLGTRVPDEMIDGAAKALLSARFENGAYAYGGSASGDDGSLKDSCGRMPMCETGLLRAGQGEMHRVVFAMENFWTYFERLERVRRNDFHSDGELAGFFFFHDFFQATEALSYLPKQAQAPHRERFFSALQTIGEMDGSFLDSHEFGRSYGTAMALLSLGNL
jgi:hypothetical protein